MESPNLIPMDKTVVAQKCVNYINYWTSQRKIKDQKAQKAFNEHTNKWRKWFFLKPLTLEQSNAKLQKLVDASWVGWVSEWGFPCLWGDFDWARELEFACIKAKGDTVYLTPETLNKLG